MRKKNAKHSFAMIATCTAAALLSTGCRSMPGRGLFGMRSQPSAEALAGGGPTTTYPVPPSHKATPEPIDSIAAGTKSPSGSAPEPTTAQVAGIEISPGYALPAGSPVTSETSPPTNSLAAPNLAAAQANGIYSGSGTAPASYKSTGGQPSGYTFGSKALTPKPTAGLASPTTENPLAGSSPLTPPSTSLSGENLSPSSTAFAPPPATNYTKPPASPTSGFTLPTDSPAMSAITPPASASSSFTPPTTSEPSGAGAATAPTFSTASTSSFGTPSGGGSSVDHSTASGYMPGSTGSAAGYPSGDITPTTSGSFYR